MKRMYRKTAAAAIGALALVATPGLAGAHAVGERAMMGPQSGHMSQEQGRPSATQPCPMETIEQGMMGSGMGAQGMMGSGTMGSGMMGSGMMGSDMMGSGMMGPGMMGSGMMEPRSGMERSQGMWVVPRAHVSTEDVRHFLEHRLAAHGNKRLKIGEVKEGDDDTIVADIVTLEDSLVQRYVVDRHSGRMTPAE